MKKITFILFALIAGTTFAQNQLMQKLKLQKLLVLFTIAIAELDLNFGKLSEHQLEEGNGMMQ